MPVFISVDAGLCRADHIGKLRLRESDPLTQRPQPFRHSHASNLISNDVNIVAVSRRLGHSNIDITLKTYTHLMKKNEDELVKSLDLSFQNLSNNKSE